MALTSNNNLLSLFNDSDLKILTKLGEIKPFLSVSPFIPWGVHVTDDNDIMVGVIDPGPLTPTDTSVRALLIFGMDCKQRHCHRYDSNRHSLFTLPWRIKTNTNKDIVVVDLIDDIGRVVVVGWDGDLGWIYTGHPKINVDTAFNPNDVATTTTGHIIVSDSRSQAVHVLSQQGDILTCKIMTEVGIKDIWTLNFDKRGQLWVGCAPMVPTEPRAKIYRVNLLW